MSNSNIVQGDNYRFTLITDKLIRLEYSNKGKFEDRPTQFARNRDLGKVDFVVKKNNNSHLLEIETDSMHLYYDGGKFKASSLYIDAKYNYGLYLSRWYFGEKIEKNLLGTAMTLDKANGAIDIDDGIMSRDGFSYIDDSKSFILDNNEFIKRDSQNIDVYYFAYGRDYRTALRDFYKLSGFPPMLPRYALGNWWSRYYKYRQQDYIDLIDRFEKEKLPFSVAVLDMDWHKTDIDPRFGSGWTGYSWNRELISNPRDMLNYLHMKGKRVTLNLHPASGVRAFEDCYPKVAKSLGLNIEDEEPALFNITDCDFRKSYFHDVHHPLEEEGVDFWWIDWQQGANRDGDKADPLWSLNHYHYTDNADRNNSEGLILSRYAGPGSHRYPLGFSGDTYITWASLAYQPYFTSTASNIGYTWWSHDIGGHYRGTYDAELSLRWLQFGVFSPINRLHSSDNYFSGKEPWNYPLNIRCIMNDYLRLRARLIPYLDSANYKTSCEGRALIEPMYYEYPECKRAYNFANQYLFGGELMVAPITDKIYDRLKQGHIDVWLPEGIWIDFFTGLRYRGEVIIKLSRGLEEIPVFGKAGAIVPMNRNYMDFLDRLPSELDIKIFAGASNIYELYEHIKASVAKTTIVFDYEKGIISTAVEDKDNIIPKDRVINFIFMGITMQDKSSIVVAGNKGCATISGEIKENDQKELALKILLSKLKFAELSYDLKKDIMINAKSYMNDPRKLNRYIETLDDKNLRSMLNEYSYLI